MNIFNPYIKSGFLEVYCGPMKSGKSYELIKRIDKPKFIPSCGIQLFKANIDSREKFTRNSLEQISYIPIPIDHPEYILDNIKSKKIIAIDEAQFFNKSLVDIIDILLQKNMNVIVAGLDLDFKGEPFGPMPYILAKAHEVTKLSAICEFPKCGHPAYYTQKLLYGKPASRQSKTILVGDETTSEEGVSYETRCRKHHFVED